MPSLCDFTSCILNTFVMPMISNLVYNSRHSTVNLYVVSVKPHAQSRWLCLFLKVLVIVLTIKKHYNQYIWGSKELVTNVLRRFDVKHDIFLNSGYHVRSILTIQIAHQSPNLLYINFHSVLEIRGSLYFSRGKINFQMLIQYAFFLLISPNVYSFTAPFLFLVVLWHFLL